MALISLRAYTAPMSGGEMSKDHSKDWLEAELEAELDEDYELELDDAVLSEKVREIYDRAHPPSLQRRDYLHQLLGLQAELK